MYFAETTNKISEKKWLSRDKSKWFACQHGSCIVEVMYMNKLFYPAIFHTAEEEGFWITFLDFPECITEGDDMEDAYRMDKA